MTFKPLLAATADLDKIKYPVLASPKVNGIRCLIHPTLGPVTRTLGPIHNAHIASALAGVPRYLDGELVTYTDGVMDDFNTVQSKVMSSEGEPDFHFIVFDSFAEPEAPFADRQAAVQAARGGVVAPLAQIEIASREALEALYAQHLADGWEGTMVRRPDAPYKLGRSTVREGILLKLKPHEDAEGIIVGVIEHAHGGKVGALSLRWKGKSFEVGTGFTDAARADLWAKRAVLIGQSVTFKYQGVGSHGRPLLPVFLGLRLDLPKAVPLKPIPAAARVRRRQPATPEWTELRAASFPPGASPPINVVVERCDDAGDVYVYVNGMPSFETFDDACARSANADQIEAIPEPTVADYERLAGHPSIGQKIGQWWRDMRRRNRWYRDFKRQGSGDPWGDVLTLEYLDEHVLTDFRIWASKRRMAGIGLEESKALYIKTRLGTGNTLLTGEERAMVRQVIQDMTPADALLPAALAEHIKAMEAFISESRVLAKSGKLPLSPGQKYELMHRLAVRP